MAADVRGEPAAPERDSGLVRLRMDIAYDGTEFSGWARQPSLRTVQGVVEGAIATICRLPEPPQITCAGRTDAGVHARGQVAHVDLPGEVFGTFANEPLAAHQLFAANAVAEQFAFRLRALLPEDVTIRQASVAPPGFDARFSALSRRYSYTVADGADAIDPLRRREVLTYPRPVDIDLMNGAAAALLGEHDFAAFCKRREGATTIRELLELNWHRDENGHAVLRITADAFCHSMVRSLVGAFLAVGDGRREPEWPAEVMALGVRSSAVMVVPPQGLVLEEVRYPDVGELLARATQTRAIRSLRQ